MKKLILVMAVSMLSFASYAQKEKEIIKIPKQMHRKQMHADGVMMKDGKMMMVKDGKMTDMVSEVTMTNGTKVMPDGNCMTANGDKMMLKEGQHIDMAGNMASMKKKMKMKMKN